MSLRCSFSASGCPMRGSNPPLLRRKRRVFHSFWIVAAKPGVAFMVRLCLNFTFLLQWCAPPPSFARCVGVTQRVSRLFPEETVADINVDSLCLWEEVSSGSSRVTNVDPFIPLLKTLASRNWNVLSVSLSFVANNPRFPGPHAIFSLCSSLSPQYLDPFQTW